MEQAYLDENVREYELTKHFSLRLDFPLAYLQLRLTGACEIEIPRNGGSMPRHPACTCAESAMSA